MTIFQAVRNPGKAEKFSFVVDDSLSRLTAFITGSSLVFTIRSPTGVWMDIENNLLIVAFDIML